MDEDADLARAIAASLEDQKRSKTETPEGDATTVADAGDEPSTAAAEEEDAKKPELSLEEKEEQAKKKLEEIKRKKDEEEKRMDRERELERIRFGKEMLAQKRLLEDQERQRVIDFRRREKDEQRRAKEKIMAEIAKDKAERRSGAQGAQPAPATREKDDKVKRRESDSVFGVKPVSTQAKIRDLLVKIKKDYAKERSEVAFKTLSAYCRNLLKVPLEAKFRSINSQNNAFKQRLASLEGGEGVSVLGLVGFKLDSSEIYVVQESSVNKLVVEAALTELANAINNPFFGAL